MDLTKIFSWFFWAQSDAVIRNVTLIGLAVFCVLLIISGIGLQYISRRPQFNSLQKGQMRVFVQPLVVLGILELIWIWINYERTPFFSRRIWFLLIALCCIGWIIRRAHIAYKIYPAEHQKHSVTLDRAKYLPKQGR